MMKRVSLIIVLFLCIHVASGREPRRDPESGRIRILYLGDAWGPTPYIHMEAEPSFLGIPIPATFAHLGTYNEGELKRFMRIYMPRNYLEYVGGYDLLILADTNRGLYRPEQLDWFERGSREEGMGIMMVGGIEGFGGLHMPSWSGTPVEDALPVICMDNQAINADFRVVVNHREDPFIGSLPWSTMPFFHGMNLVNARDGSRTLLHADIDPGHPVLVHWEYGKGSGLAHMPCWHPAWGYSIMYHWDFYPDYVINMNYLNVGVDIPQNPEMMHRIRSSLGNYKLNRAVAVSLMDFVERFGADVSTGEEHLSEIDRTYRQVQELFIDQDYDRVSRLLDSIGGEFQVLSDELVELKDRALLWIYVIELLSVSGTSIIVGFILWSLMVRRKFYREVSFTRTRL